MRKTAHSEAALFRFRGVPPLGMAVSMALQHLVSMIVGCVTPAIIIANTVGLPQSQRVLLIQASLVMSAVTTLLELFPIGGRFGAGLPVIFGVSFAYLPSMQPRRRPFPPPTPRAFGRWRRREAAARRWR